MAAFIYTHPRPDHVNGMTWIRGDLSVPVYATVKAERVSRRIDGPKRASWTAVSGVDYPARTVRDRPGPRWRHPVIGGLRFTVHAVGAGECATAAVWVTDDTAFLGDLVYSRVPPWLFEALSTCGWPSSSGPGRRWTAHAATPGTARLATSPYSTTKPTTATSTSTPSTCCSRPALPRRPRQGCRGRPDGCGGRGAVELVTLSADPVTAPFAVGAIRRTGPATPPQPVPCH